MSAHITRSRVVATGAAVLALAVMTGCGGTKVPSAAAPTTSSPTAAQTPTGSAATSETTAPSVTTAPAKAAPGSTTRTKSGTTLKFGKTANVQAGDGEDSWIGGLKVTALEKAPASDFKALGFRGAGSVYYLRYEVTYVAGTPTNPISASHIGPPRFYPSDARGQFELTWGGMRTRVSMHVNPSSLQSNEPFNPSPSFKNCRQVVYQDTGGHFHNYTDELAVGETATNLCLPFVVDKGTLTQVHYGAMLADGSSYSVTWK